MGGWVLVGLIKMFWVVLGSIDSVCNYIAREIVFEEMDIMNESPRQYDLLYYLIVYTGTENQESLGA